MSEPAYTLRAAGPADLPQIMDLDAEAFGEYGTAESAKTIAARLAAFAEGFLVVEGDEGILAYASAEQWLSQREPALDEDPLHTHHSEGRILCITAMAVRRGFRGRGLGTMLFDALIDLARRRGCAQVMLETTHAQEFYRRRGFGSLGVRVQQGVILEVMALILDEGANPGEPKK